MQGSASQEARLSNSHETFTTAISGAAVLAGELINEQTEYAAAVAFLRESGATVIQDIRAAGLDRAAADAFQLVVGTLDFAGRDASVRGAELERLLVTLGRDQRVDQMPGDVALLRSSVATILTNKPLIESKLKQLIETPVGEHAEALSAAAQDMYAIAATRIDQARLMLGVYAVVLLLAVGFVAFRLHTSYREINRTNADLAALNESLEQRVSTRTQKRCRRWASSSPASATRSTRLCSISRTTPSSSASGSGRWAISSRAARARSRSSRRTFRTARLIRLSS
jgi:hypothetical protein